MNHGRCFHTWTHVCRPACRRWCGDADAVSAMPRGKLADCTVLQLWCSSNNTTYYLTQGHACLSQSSSSLTQLRSRRSSRPRCCLVGPGVLHVEANGFCGLLWGPCCFRTSFLSVPWAGTVDCTAWEPLLWAAVVMTGLTHRCKLVTGSPMGHTSSVLRVSPIIQCWRRFHILSCCNIS